MKGVKVVHILDNFYWYGISRFKFSNVFVRAKTHFMLLLGRFFARAPQKQLTFLSRGGKQDDESEMLQFFEVLRNDLNWTKKLIFWLMLRVYLFTSLCTLWDTPQDFAKWKNLFHLFISIAYVVVKWKIFKVFYTDSVFMK